MVTLALANKLIEGTALSDHSEVITNMTVEVSALLLAVVRHWSDLAKGSQPEIVDISKPHKPAASVKSIILMLQALRSALKWALEISNLADLTFTSELLASILYILNCAPKSMPFMLAILTCLVRISSKIVRQIAGKDGEKTETIDSLAGRFDKTLIPDRCRPQVGRRDTKGSIVNLVCLVSRFWYS